MKMILIENPMFELNIHEFGDKSMIDLTIRPLSHLTSRKNTRILDLMQVKLMSSFLHKNQDGHKYIKLDTNNPWPRASKAHEFIPSM